MKLKCIIVDDEPLARGVIETYLKEFDFIETVASCNNAMEALNYLNKSTIDILFLDINMPKIDGLSFLRTLKSAPQVIITTAYREYAIEGFELDVVDYLCKPFSFERFLVAVNKAIGRIKAKTENYRISNSLAAEPNITKHAESYLFVKSEKKTYKIELDEILFVEAVGDYIKIISTGKSLICYMYLKEIELMLPANLFPRVHRSFLVSLSKIDSVEGNQIKIRESIIPIGRRYRENFISLLS
ncbi:MAG: response regulator transcription factor [Bacteroidota bacterium]|nr:MAG: response regulator transcription factor [Bacteroidota bacterium]